MSFIVMEVSILGREAAQLLYKDLYFRGHDNVMELFRYLDEKFDFKIQRLGLNKLVFGYLV